MPTKVQLLSVIIPVRNEESCVTKTVEALLLTLRKAEAPFEIITIDDQSTDGTRALLMELMSKNHEVRYLENTMEPGFGNAVQSGLSKMKGDAAVIFMADQSDNPDDVVTYREKLNEGYDCVFGSRFVKGGRVIRVSTSKTHPESTGQQIDTVHFWHSPERYDQRLQGLSQEGCPGMPTPAFTPLQPDGGTAPESHYQRLHLDGCSHRLAEPEKR